MQQTTITAASWPIPGDSPDLETIIADQAETISATEALLHAYQGNLNSAQNPPPGTAATSSGAITTGATTSITCNGTTGVIKTGATVGGTGLSTNPTVLGQISGAPGGDGVYLLSAPVTFTTVTSLTFTPPPPASTWPTPSDAPTLSLIVQQQTAIIRLQTALMQSYQDLLNTSQTPAPPTGP